jgi:exocyst complex component 7
LEYELLLTMSLVTSTGATQATYATLLAPINSLFTTTLTLLINLIKSNRNKHVFLALASYEELSNAQPAWNDVQKRAGKKENELKENLVALRGVCLRSFPEFLLDVRGAGTKITVDVGTGIHETTIMVVNYLQQIPQVMDAVGTALTTLGDGMWKMGEGAGKVLGKSDQDDERLVIEHFVCECGYDP